MGKRENERPTTYGGGRLMGKVGQTGQGTVRERVTERRQGRRNKLTGGQSAMVGTARPSA